MTSRVAVPGRFPLADQLAIASAAVLGAGVRWALSATIDTDPAGIGWATLAANLAGCLVLGIVAARLVPGRPGQAHAPAELEGWRRAVAVGFCGGLTTFSTLAVAVAVGLRDGRALVAASDLGLSVVTGLGAVVLGVAIGRRGATST